MSKFRYCVGSPDGPRSSVWTLWTNLRSAYIQTRMMGSSTKVSIHDQEGAQWSGQWSMQSDWYGRNRPNRPNRERHICKWTCDRPDPTTAAHVFRILVPDSELRVVTIQENLRQVHWLPVPTPKYVICVECYITPPVEGTDFHYPYKHLVSLPLGYSEWFVVLVHEEKLTASITQQLALLRAMAATDLGSPPPPEYRGVGVLKTDKGVHGMIEFVPGPQEKN
jgi:hypothetical protein